MFDSVAQVEERLRDQGYICDRKIATVVFLAYKLEKPVLVEGPAGVGKTELAKALSRATERRLIRLQCYEGLDEAKALYEWNYRKQLLRLQADQGREWAEVEADIFTEDFLLTRPLLEAIRHDPGTRDEIAAEVATRIQEVPGAIAAEHERLRASGASLDSQVLQRFGLENRGRRFAFGQDLTLRTKNHLVVPSESPWV